MDKNLNIPDDYFTLGENYRKFIYRALSEEYNSVEIKKLHLNSTGWTNIVYEVDTNKGDFIFRFPRDLFWAKTIVKDYQFAKYIKGKTSFKTVELLLKKNNGRLFSMHKKISGTTLINKSDKLSDGDINKVCQQIAKFMYELHNLNYIREEIFFINNIGLDLQDFITELLCSHISSQNMKFWSEYNFKDTAKSHRCLVHGDLNPSNILLDDDNNISAIIDFGFGGFGNKYFDIARIIGRCHERFKDQIIYSYAYLEGSSLEMDKINMNIEIWNKIDTAYINYMRSRKII